MKLELNGRHALVCGASQGIGRASAIELAELGASVTVLARSEEALTTVVNSLPRPSADQRHQHCAVDMLDTAALRNAANTIVAERSIHILINNTGGPAGGPVHEAAPEAFEQAFRQHVIAGQTLLQALLPGMREAQFGRVVNVISTSVKEPIPNLGVSNTVRAAVAAWAKTLSGELAAHGITVNNVLPGFTRTGRLASLINARAKAGDTSEKTVSDVLLAQVPAGRFGEAEEVAAVIAFLCTPAAAYVNGASIPVDGGRTRSLS